MQTHNGPFVSVARSITPQKRNVSVTDINVFAGSVSFQRDIQPLSFNLNLEMLPLPLKKKKKRCPALPEIQRAENSNLVQTLQSRPRGIAMSSSSCKGSCISAEI